MSIVKSRVKKGKLTFTPDGEGAVAVDFSCQPTNVTIETSYDEDGDKLEVLCGDEEGATLKTSRTLKLTAIQDFDNKEGLQAFLWTHETQTVAFSWQPNADGGPTYTGRCQCQVGPIGGDVGAQLTTELELPIVGAVTPTWAAPPEEAAKAKPGKG